MAQKDVKTKQNTPYTALYHLLSVFFLCLGVAGTILMAASVPEISFSAAFLIAVSSGVIAALYLSNLFSRPLFFSILAAVVIFCIFFILSNREAFSQQWQFLFGGMIPEPGEATGEIGRVALIFCVLFSLILFIFDILLRLHIISFFITSAFFLIPTLFGYSFPAFALFITVIYQLAFFVLPLSFKSYTSKSEKMQQRIRVKSTLLTVAAALISLAVAAPVAFSLREKAFKDITRMENAALNNIGLSPFSLLYNDEGNVNRGDNEQNGVITLRLSSDRVPVEPMYLRGYFGGNYYGTYWDAPTDNVIFQALAPASDISTDENVLEDFYNALRYHTSTLNEGGNFAAINLNIQNLNINRSVIFRPYNASEENKSGGSSYSFKLYEFKDLHMTFSDNDPDKLLSYRQLFRDYYADAYDNYTYITAESIPLLKQLVKDNPLESIQEISSFIIKTLEEHAEYTLTPGKAPEGADTVDYLLFENHKGYCQQFASAAVLMYRLYGIPARYATGFRVKPDDFIKNEKEDSFEATVTDKSAHAWPEILLPEYGWVPVEVTPGANQGIAAGVINESSEATTPENAPTEPVSTTESGLTENTSEDDTASMPEANEAEAENEAAGASQGISNESQTGKSVSPANILPWLIPIAAGAAVVLLYFLLRRRKMSPDSLSFNDIYKRLAILLKNAPAPVECRLSDKEFPKQLTRAIPEITIEEAAQAHDNILSALYGRDGGDAEHTQKLFALYKKCADYIIPKTPAGKRAILKYIRMLG